MSENNTLYIILDTNFLLVPFQFRVNLKSKFDELIDRKYEIVILEDVYNELLKIYEKARGRRKQEISAAIKYYKTKELAKNFKKKDDEDVDDFLIRIARNKNYIVATNDKSLKKRLKEQGSNFIYLRQKAFFKSYRPLD